MSRGEDAKRAKPASADAEARPQAVAEAEKRGGAGEAQADESKAPLSDEATVRVYRVKMDAGQTYRARAFVRGRVVAAAEGWNRHAAFGGAAAGLLYYWQAMGTSPPPGEEDPPVA